MKRLSHLDAQGAVRMVDVGGKRVTSRSARARALVRLPPECVAVMAAGGRSHKGNVFQVARLAGIMAAKRTSDFVPLCHPLELDGVDVGLRFEKNVIAVQTTVRNTGRTGAEMEALTAAAGAALAIYDMLKGLSHDVVIERIELVEKRGGRSGVIRRRVSRRR
jgi:cyclic pyranopterin monophosphate synthase